MKHRVCLVTNYLSAGGLERVLTRLATYFVEKKEVQVTIVTLFNTQCFYSLSDKVEVIYPNFDILAINKHVRIIKQFFYLRHKIKELRPDCVLRVGNKNICCR